MRRLAIWIFLCTFFLGIIGVVRINHKIRNMGIDFNLPIEIEAKIEEIIPNNEQYKIICRLRSYTQNDDKKFQSFKFILYHSQNLKK